MKKTSETSEKTAEKKSEKASEKTAKKKGLSVKTICYCAVMTALSVVANTFTIYFSVGNSNALSFVYTVCFLSGALLGPFAGFIVGVCGDVLGWLINNTGGAFNPVITLVSGLIGLISGLVFFVAKKIKKENALIPLTVISYVLILLICTNLNTFAMYYYYMTAKYSLKAYYIIRMPKQVVFWAINMVLGILLIKPLKKILKL